MNNLIKKPMPLEACLKVISTWILLGGSKEIDIAALEPLLWRQGNENIGGLISSIKSLDELEIKVNLTTNGILLAQYAADLLRSKIDKIRVSWPTCNPVLYHEIVRKNCYEQFMGGIEKAISIGLPVQFNRILLKGHTDDLPQQLDFISRHNLHLKLYDLYWTPTIAPHYKEYYIDCDHVIEKYILPVTSNVSNSDFRHVRSRRIYFLNDGGQVEVKLKNSVNKKSGPCHSCSDKSHCIESYGDYLRIDPDLTAFPCYLRRDLKEKLDFDKNNESVPLAQTFSNYLMRVFGESWESRIMEMKLRMIIVPYCNARCSLPGTDSMICLKSMGNYSFSGGRNEKRQGATNE